MAIQSYRSGSPPSPTAGANLADILERVLDKGIVIAGDIVVNLLDIELLTIKLRLLIASADTAQKMGIDWWQDDPFVSTRARQEMEAKEPDERPRLEQQQRTEKRLERIEEALEALVPRSSSNGRAPSRSQETRAR